MKKMCSIILMFVLVASVFAGCCLKHEWVEATCEAPITCVKCGKTDGAPKGHSWLGATCIAPEICADCASTRGEALGHNWSEASCIVPKTCTRCQETEGNTTDHVFSDWSIYGNVWERSCVTCGKLETKEVDPEEYGTELLLGKWTSFTVVGPRGTVAWNDYHATFKSDGTAVLELDSSFKGTWKWSHYESVGRYVFYYYYGNESVKIYVVPNEGMLGMTLFLDDTKVMFFKVG